MEKITVDVQWCDKNFGATFGDNVPGAVVLTAKSYEELLREVPETLRFHVEGMVKDGDNVPQWLRDGDYEFVFNLIDVATSPKTGKDFKMSNHGSEEVATGTLNAILKAAGLK